MINEKSPIGGGGRVRKMLLLENKKITSCHESYNDKECIQKMSRTSPHAPLPTLYTPIHARTGDNIDRTQKYNE